VKKTKVQIKILLEKKMKNRKWLTYTVGVLLTLVILAVVGGAGFRIGMMQNASFARPFFAHNFDGGSQVMQGNSQNNGGNQSTQGNFHDNGGTQAMQGNPHNQGFDNRGNNRGNDRKGGISFFSPIFGLIHFVVLGLLLWLGYKLVKKSGWRLTRAQVSPAPVANETPSVEVEKKKESE
jgi:hypothetical protein